MVSTPLAQGLDVLARFFCGDGTVDEALTRISELTVRAVPAAEMVGLTMVVRGRQCTAVYTDAAAVEIDQVQYDTGEGPCLAAFSTQEITTIPSTAEKGPWPEFRRAAAAHGIASTLSFPMVANRTSLGAMNLYSRQEHGFERDDWSQGQLFAAQATFAKAYWDAHQLSAGLGEAMRNRAAIEQAKGILMGAQRIDEDTAFEMLVSASQRENLKLRDIAVRLVTNVAGGAALEQLDGSQRTS